MPDNLGKLNLRGEGNLFFRHFRFSLKIMNRRNGDLGESLAENHLVKKGYRLIEKNFFSRYGEIDLVMADGNMLVFVEVKFRTSMKFGGPLESVGWRKKERMRKTIYQFLEEKEYAGAWRIDVVGILETNGRHEFNHVKFAF